MEYIIDGYNVIRSSYLKEAEQYSSEAGQLRLISLVQNYKRKHPGVFFTIVFDGVGSLTYPGIGIIYSGDISADEKIIQMISRTDKKEYIVVSDDREIQTGARIFACKYIGVNDFMVITEKVRKPTKTKYMEKKDIPIELPKIEKELLKYYEKKIQKI